MSCLFSNVDFDPTATDTESSASWDMATAQNFE